MTHFARPPAFTAERGGLVGRYPWVYPGSSAGSWRIFDDFTRAVNDPVAARIGDLSWSGTLIRIGASEHTGSFADVTPDAATEFGVARVSTNVLDTGATSGDGGALGWPDAVGPWYQGPPVSTLGSVFRAKVRSFDLFHTNKVIWSGWASAYNTSPRSTNSIDFIGIRYATDLSNNWHGVVRSGTSETTVDLGIAGNAGEWIIAGFQRTSAGIQFFVDTIGDVVEESTNVGDPVTTNIPTSALKPLPLGLVMLSAVLNKTAQIDFFESYGRIAR